MERQKNKFFIGYVTGVAVMLGSQLIGDVIAGEPSISSQEIQLNNAQIEAELEESFDPVDELIIDGKSFTFHTDGAEGNLACSGKFKTVEDIATVAGDLTCSYAVEVATNDN